MKTGLFIITLLFLPVSLLAQTDEGNILPQRDTSAVVRGVSTTGLYDPASPIYNWQPQLVAPRNAREKNIGISISPLESAHMMQLYSQPSHHSMQSLMWNNEYGVDRIARNLYHYRNSNANIYYSIGSVSEVGGGLVYMPTDRLIITGGVFAANNYLSGSRYIDGGVRVNVKYWVADRLAIIGVGQYSVNGMRADYNLPYSMVPTNYYGGGVEVKITQNLGVQFMVTRAYDPMRQKWVTSYGGAPVVYP